MLDIFLITMLICVILGGSRVSVTATQRPQFGIKALASRFRVMRVANS